MAPIHHHFEQKGWSESTIVIRFWIISIILALVGLASLKLSMIEVERSIFIPGLGISGMSLAKNLNFRNVYCWDDKSSIRDLAKRNKITLKEPIIKNLKNIDFMVISSGINHELENPHNAIKIAQKIKYTNYFRY